MTVVERIFDRLEAFNDRFAYDPAADGYRLSSPGYLASLLSACVGISQEVSMPTPELGAEAPLGMPNPASVFCEEQGGRLDIRTGADGGQFGVCIFADGSECEEWAFYRGECRRRRPAMRRRFLRRRLRCLVFLRPTWPWTI